jgi:hypothetical protein
LLAQAHDALDGAELSSTDTLRQLADWVVDRTH